MNSFVIKIFSSTQVKRAEKSSTSEVYATLRKQKNTTTDLKKKNGKEKVFSTKGVFQLEQV